MLILQTMASENGETGSKSRGLLAQFSKGQTLLGLKVCSAILVRLEQLNRSLQAKSATLGGMLQAVGEMTKELLSLRTDAAFDAIFDQANNMIEDTGIEKLVDLRVRRPPKRFDGNSEAYQAPSIQVQYRLAYYAIVDNAITQLQQRFSEESPIVQTYLQLQNMLITYVDNWYCQFWCV